SFRSRSQRFVRPRVRVPSARERNANVLFVVKKFGLFPAVAITVLKRVDRLRPGNGFTCPAKINETRKQRHRGSPGGQTPKNEGVSVGHDSWRLPCSMLAFVPVSRPQSPSRACDDTAAEATPTVAQGLESTSRSNNSWRTTTTANTSRIIAVYPKRMPQSILRAALR